LDTVFLNANSVRRRENEKGFGHDMILKPRALKQRPHEELQGCSEDTGRRDDCHGDLLFPPERGEHGSRCELRKINHT
jgi:hypothetical protein